MKGLHAWGVFRRSYDRKSSGWRLISHHKSQIAALSASRSGDYVRRISAVPFAWRRG